MKTGDGAKCKGTAAEGHCFPVAGTPKPDVTCGWDWWSTLFVGIFSVLHRLDPSLRYVHVWNEPNAHFWMDKQPDGTPLNGTWFAEFYLPVAKALLTAFPEEPNPKTGFPNAKTGIVVGGPVTYSPPFQKSAAGQINDKTWVDWFEPLIRASEDNPNLLGWVDFHAYDGADPHGKCQPGPNCLNAEASTIDINLQEIAIVSEALGRPGIQTAITETNFQLEKASDEFDWSRRYAQRGLGLVQQTMVLLRAPGQVIFSLVRRSHELVHVPSIT